MKESKNKIRKRLRYGDKKKNAKKVENNEQAFRDFTKVAFLESQTDNKPWVVSPGFLPLPGLYRGGLSSKEIAELLVPVQQISFPKNLIKYLDINELIKKEENKRNYEEAKKKLFGENNKTMTDSKKTPKRTSFSG